MSQRLVKVAREILAEFGEDTAAMQLVDELLRDAAQWDEEAREAALAGKQLYAANCAGRAAAYGNAAQRLRGGKGG